MIQIDILLPQDTYVPGQLLEGMVQIKADATLNYESLDFQCTWTDPGNNDEVGRQSGSILRAGAIRVGEERRVPFAVQIPEQSSSAVRLDDLRWELRAELRLRDDENPVVTKAFEVKLRRAREEKFARSKFFSNNKTADTDDRAGKAARPAPTTIGDVVGGLFISSFFFAAIGGGASLVFNGYPHKILPDFVPWFGLACILGGLFVVQKIWEGLYPAFGRGLVALLTTALTVVGVAAASYLPGLSILNGPADAWQFSGLEQLGHWTGQLAWVTAVCTGVWLAHTLSKRREREPSAITAFIMLGIVGVGTSVGAFLSPERLNHTTEIHIAGLIGAVALIVAATNKSWRRPSARLALISMAAPLLIAVGLSLSAGEAGILAGGTMCALLAFYAFFTLRSIAAEAWLGEVQLRTEPEKPFPGGTFRLEVVLRPRKNVTIQNIHASLVCTHHHRGADPEDNDSSVVNRLALKGMFPVQIQAGMTMQLPLSAVLPLDADPTETGSSGYSWELQVHIDLAGAPDWEDIIPVVVER